MAREKDQPSAQFMQRKNTRIVSPLLPSNILLTAWYTHCAVLCFFAKTFQYMYLKHLIKKVFLTSHFLEQEGMGKRLWEQSCCITLDCLFRKARQDKANPLL